MDLIASLGIRGYELVCDAGIKLILELFVASSKHDGLHKRAKFRHQLSGLVEMRTYLSVCCFLFAVVDMRAPAEKPKTSAATPCNHLLSNHQRVREVAARFLP
jgi:hypothetical protein